ncbi:MAG TPA: nuclear transport factor 2 family protein [Burkholderiaceae bacterium]|jgi:hypothetical protein|nr:nuclear transport factor 2 family protein [Burkholderiaceae bacterium]
METLLEIERIWQLKYRYFRAVDRHDWALLESCLAEDCRTALASGQYSFNSRAEFVNGLKALLDRPTIVTMHHGHHPEIELVAPDRAKGRWYLEDHVIDLEQNLTLHGTAYYDDEYVKRDGQWCIAFTGYERVFETVTSPIPAALRVTANLFEPRS